MTTNNFYRSALPKLHDITQNAVSLYPKELIIATIRDFFSDDDYYHYVHDKFGFPQTPNQTGLPQSAGFADDLTTRLFVGESYRFDKIYYPAIIVRHGGSTSVPISINRETASVQWDFMVFQDGYGNIKKFPIPVHYILAGAWEGNINIDVRARDPRARDDLADLISLLFVDIAFNDLVKAGLVVKGVSSSSPAETGDRSDILHSQTITLQIRSEWRRHVPITNILDIINTSVEFGRLDPTPGPIAPNLTINNVQTITEVLENL